MTLNLLTEPEPTEYRRILLRILFAVGVGVVAAIVGFLVYGESGMLSGLLVGVLWAYHADLPRYLRDAKGSAEPARDAPPGAAVPAHKPDYVLIFFVGLFALLVAMIVSRLYDGGAYTVILAVAFPLWAMNLAYVNGLPDDGREKAPETKTETALGNVGAFAVVAVPLMLVLAAYDGLTTTPDELVEQCVIAATEYQEAEARLVRTIRERDRAWDDLAASEWSAVGAGIRSLFGGGEARRAQTRAELDVLRKSWSAGILDGQADVQQESLARLEREVVQHCTAAGMWPLNEPDEAPADEAP